MSDRSYLTVTVYGFTPGKADELQAIIEDVAGPEYGEDMPCLAAGGPPWRFVEEEAQLYAYHDLVDALIGCDPGVSVEAQNEARYEYMAGLSMYAPDLGRFDADCNTDGEPMFSAGYVLKLVKMPEDERRESLGLPWTERFAAIRKAAAA